MGYSEQINGFPQQDTRQQYTVQNGDTFESIASQYGTYLLTDETGRLVDGVQPGQVIYIDNPIQYRMVDGQLISNAGGYDAIAAQDAKRRQAAAQYGWTIDHKDQEEWTQKEPQPKWYESEYWGDISAGLEAAANADEGIKQHYYNGPVMSTAGAAGHMSPDELAYADQWMYDYTPYGNYVQFWSPSRWLYSLKSAFTDDEFMAPWNKRNPGVSDDQNVNMGIDLLTAFLPFFSKKIRFGKANPVKKVISDERSVINRLSPEQQQKISQSIKEWANRVKLRYNQAFESEPILFGDDAQSKFYLQELEDGYPAVFDSRFLDLYNISNREYYMIDNDHHIVMTNKKYPYVGDVPRGPVAIFDLESLKNMQFHMNPGFVKDANGNIHWTVAEFKNKDGVRQPMTPRIMSRAAYEMIDAIPKDVIFSSNSEALAPSQLSFPSKLKFTLFGPDKNPANTGGYSLGIAEQFKKEMEKSARGRQNMLFEVQLSPNTKLDRVGIGPEKEHLKSYFGLTPDEEGQFLFKDMTEDQVLRWNREQGGKYFIIDPETRTSDFYVGRKL